MSTRILLLYGGESTEHEVSIRSARNVREALNPALFDVDLGFIDKTGRWWLVPDIVDDVVAGSVELLPILGNETFAAGERMIDPDVILPVLHGPNGEDGSVQALAQLTHLPIVGCDMTASAVGMNKLLTKQLAQANGIAVVPFVVHHAADPIPLLDSLDLGGQVVFVKPSNAGSSVGVSKVHDQEGLEAALRAAHKHGTIAIIEQAINARELEVAVLGNYPNVKASVVGEVKPDREFYSYESKYDENSVTELIIPADITPEVSDQIRHKALKIFTVIGGSGLARVDFFLDNATGQIYLNELNTIPGFTDISMYSKLWQASGLAYDALLEELIRLALEGTMNKKEYL